MYVTALAGKGVYIRSFSGPAYKPAYGNVFTAIASVANKGTVVREECSSYAALSVRRVGPNRVGIDYICGGAAYPLTLVARVGNATDAAAVRRAVGQGLHAVLDFIARSFEDIQVPRPPATKIETLILAFARETHREIASTIRSLSLIRYAYASSDAHEVIELLRMGPDRLTGMAKTLHSIALSPGSHWIDLYLENGLRVLLSPRKYNIVIGGVGSRAAMLVYEPRSVANRMVFLAALLKVKGVRVRRGRILDIPVMPRTIGVDVEPVLITGVAGYPDPETLHRIADKLVKR